MRKLWECVQRFSNWCTNHKAITAFVFALLLLVVPLHYSLAIDSELFTKFLTNPIDVVMLTLAGIIQVVTGAIGKLILLIIQVIVIPVLGYNGFYNSHITNLGWSLVRDVVNMFVVVVLMVIAIMTIVGYSKANWTQQLPRLFIAIVLVNFSKLVCGFLIDVSQVIMFTFVNAIVSIAAGNFASMLSMDSFGQLDADFIDKINATGVGMGAFEFLMGAYLQFIVMLAILGVMFLLAVAFVWRIVVLWILIIMSPMAFFLGGIKDVFGAAGKSYEEWWSKFSSALTFGPVMCFFLWLALAASSGSNLARTEDFPMPESQNDTGLQLEMFSLDNFLGMFIALAILIAGMQQASSSAQALGGFASKMLSEDMGKGLVKGLARPFSSAKSLSRGAASQLAKPRDLPFGLDNLRQNAVEKGAKGMANLGASMQSVKGLGYAGSAISALGGYAAVKAGEGRTEKNKAGADENKYRAQTDDQKKLAHQNLLNGASRQSILDAEGKPIIGKDGKPMSRSSGVNMYDEMTEDEEMASRRKFMTNPDERKKIEEASKKMHSTGPNAKSGKALAAAVKNDMDDLTREQLAFADSDEGKRKLALDDNDKKLVAGMKMENLHLIEPKGVPKPGEKDYDKKKYDDAQQQAMKDAIDSTEGYNHRIHGARSLGNANVRKVLSEQSSGRTTTDGKFVSALDDLKLQGNDSQKKALREAIGPDEVTNSSADMATVVNSGALNPESPNATPATRKGGDVAEAVRERVRNASAGGVTNVDGLAAGNLHAAGYNSDEVLGDGFSAAAAAGGTAFTGDQRARAGAMVTANAANAGYLPAQSAGTANEVTHLIANSTSKEGIKTLQTNMNAETDPAKRAQMQRGLDNVTASVKAERAHAVANGGANSDRAKKMKELENQASEAGGGRYAGRPAAAPRPPTPPNNKNNNGGGNNKKNNRGGGNGGGGNNGGRGGRGGGNNNGGGNGGGGNRGGGNRGGGNAGGGNGGGGGQGGGGNAGGGGRTASQRNSGGSRPVRTSAAKPQAPSRGSSQNNSRTQQAGAPGSRYNNAAPASRTTGVDWSQSRSSADRRADGDFYR